MKQAVVWLSLLLALAFGWAPPALGQGATGVRGTVLRTPVFGNPPADPKMRAPHPQADIPVSVMDGRGRTVAHARSDKAGKFQFTLPPGHYTIKAGAGALTGEATVDVAQGWQTVTLGLSSPMDKLIPHAAPAR